jgi:arginyl-tRNA synthetase
MAEERLAIYLSRGRDSTPPQDSRPFRLGHPVVFAGQTKVWGSGGVAFLDSHAGVGCTVVDADDLMNDMTQTAATISKELGKLEEYSQTEKEVLYKMIGLGALKYYILKVDPKKRILFNPEESVDFQGNTGPFIQYTYARIQSILRKADFDTSVSIAFSAPDHSGRAEDVILIAIEGLHPKEKELIKQLQLFPETVQLAAENYSPALMANYVYDLVKEFNSFYQNISILGETDHQRKVLRVLLSKKVGEVIKSGFGLLGIDVPERM